MSGNMCAFPECRSPLVEPGGTITGEICHIRAQKPGGARFDGTQTETDRQGYKNLILLCGQHHKIVDAKAALYSVDVLERMKTVQEQKCGRAERETDGIFAQLLLNAMPQVDVHNNTGNVVVSSPGAIVGGVINIRSASRRPTFRAAEGTIGASGNESRYIQYLINRYNEFASKEPSRSTKFNTVRSARTSSPNSAYRGGQCPWTGFLISVCFCRGGSAELASLSPTPRRGIGRFRHSNNSKQKRRARSRSEGQCQVDRRGAGCVESDGRRSMATSDLAGLCAVLEVDRYIRRRRAGNLPVTHLIAITSYANLPSICGRCPPCPSNHFSSSQTLIRP